MSDIEDAVVVDSQTDSTAQAEFKEVEGTVESPQQKEAVFTGEGHYMAAIDFLSWSRPVVAHLQTGQLDANTPATKVIYVRENV